jgi:Tfp pilus assembly protein PilN
MRAVNLIPVEDRRGDHAPTRTGALVYIVVGALLAGLAGVTMMVLATNEINDRKAEIAQLEAEEAEARARAEALSSYAQFKLVRDTRVATVTSLADSRFDWERVLRELSLVLPADIWLTGMTGTVRPDVDVEEATDVSLRDSAAGPALEIIGCAPSQQAVGGFVSALRDIDGVTRVGILRSERPPLDSTGGQTTDEEDCRTRDFITQFELVAAFDAAPVPLPAASPDGLAPVAPAPTDPAAGSEATPTSAEAGSTG